MAVPLSQMWTVASYIVGQKVKRNQHYPLVLQLEPLFRCNLACAGCGKIQYPAHILKRELSPEQCFRAAEECGAPMVAIPGGEPMMHPKIDQIVKGLVERKKYIYVCTNAILLKEKLDQFTPSKYLSFSVHMDGIEDNHDFAVCREGVYKVAAEAIREAVGRGFRVTTNCTLFRGTNAAEVRQYFDEMTALGVEAMMVSPGYSYSKAPDQNGFLHHEQTRELFSTILSNRKKSWSFNQSPLFLEFLMGHREFDCTPWGIPTYNIFGWQKPCYLLQEGYADTFEELIRETRWSDYGHASGNPKCRDCMVHSGFEPSAVNYTFSGPRGLWATVKAMVFNRYANAAAATRLAEAEKTKGQGHAPGTPGAAAQSAAVKLTVMASDAA